MGIQLLLVLLGVVVLGGLLLGLWLNYAEAEKAREPAKSTITTKSEFYDTSVHDGSAASSDHVVLHLEHYLRRERTKAQRFAESPSLDALLENEEDGRSARGAG